ncbi:hypothetical protein Leryth_025403 [Lithospermum erythrorhizon]|nr:hypothetical protein Leryth_025403 [Lithospermum erythrorhizon]
MLKFLRIFPSKLTPKYNPFNNNYFPNIFKNKNNNNNVLHSLKYSNSTQIEESRNPTTPSAKPNHLIKRLLAFPNHHNVSIIPILNQWVQQVNDVVNVSDLFSILRLLRTNKRFHQALQLGEWMIERKYLQLSPGNVALKLDLINKVHGVVKAEDYFRSIPDELKTFKVYGALLNCFAENRLLDKAENVMQQMRKLNYASELSYAVLLNLYAKVKDKSKFDDLVQEMETKGLIRIRTYCILLNFYADNADVERMENLLSKMEDNQLIKVEWNVYVIVAKGYLKARLAEKSSEMLKKAEKHITGGKWHIAHLHLITMYATLGDGNEVERIWNLFKASGTKNNLGYFYMISSLVKLDKMDFAEKVLKDWETENGSFDFRIPNVMINAYTKKGLLEKAEALVKKALDSGKEPPVSTWDLLATGYYKHNQMEKAVETMMKAINGYRRSWKLNRVTLAACHKYLKGKGDIQMAEKFHRNLEKFGPKSHNSSTRTPPLKVSVNDHQLTHLQAS